MAAAEDLLSLAVWLSSAATAAASQQQGGGGATSSSWCLSSLPLRRRQQQASSKKAAGADPMGRCVEDINLHADDFRAGGAGYGR